MAPIFKKKDDNTTSNANQQTSQPYFDRKKIWSAFDVDLTWDDFKLTNEEEEMGDSSMQVTQKESNATTAKKKSITRDQYDTRINNMSQNEMQNKKKRFTSFTDDQKHSDNEGDETRMGEEEHFKIPKKEKDILNEVKDSSLN